MINDRLSAPFFESETRLNLDASGLLEPVTILFNFEREIMLR
jgi:hypothetical protein